LLLPALQLMVTRTSARLAPAALDSRANIRKAALVFIFFSSG
jgi:hypothetical protein